MVCDETTLKKLTKVFWTERKSVARAYGHRSGEIDSIWETYYINGPFQHEGTSYPPLLSMELDYAVTHGKVARNVPEQPLTLVILVGLTFEPLLQSIMVHQPQILVPVLNHAYGDDLEDEDKNLSWEKHWRTLAEYVDMLPISLEVDEPEKWVGDSAEEVFSYLTQNDKLRAALTDPAMRVVIDITGAKKTMVAGAFLLGMQSKAEIWYVDTTKYEEGRPYGFSCHFRRVDQSIHDLKMEAWGRVEKAYQQYHFLWAKELIPTGYRGKLPLFFEMLHQWDNGNLKESKRCYDDLKDGLIKGIAPSSINELEPFWPDTNSNQATLDKRLFSSPAYITLYAREEMERIQRLVGFDERADYRAAYMRAFALHETLLKARLISLLSPQSDEDWERLLHRTGENEARQRLESQALNAQVNGRMFDFPTNYSILKDVRNRVAHTYYALDEQFVLDIVSLVETNVQNYEAQWATPLDGKRLDKPKWEAVKKLFDLGIIEITRNQIGAKA